MTWKNFCSPWTYEKEDGTWVGKHQGAHFFTVGQRKGLNVGGKEEPLFVISTDVENNRIYVGQGQIPSGTCSGADLKIIPGRDPLDQGGSGNGTGGIQDYLVRIRYRQPLQEGCSSHD